MRTEEFRFVVMSTYKSGSRNCHVFRPLIALDKAVVQVIKDVHVLEILLVQCAMRVGRIGTEMIAVCSLGLVSSAMAKEDAFQILRHVSVKNISRVQLARYAPQNFSAQIAPDIAMIFRLVMVKESVT